MCTGQLLLGVELEFYVPPEASPERAPQKSMPGLQRRLLKDAVYLKMAKAIRAAGLPAAMLINVRSSEYSSQLVKQARPGSIWKNLMAMGPDRVDSGATHPGYRYWLVKDEDDLWGEEQGWVAAKCSSPILTHSQASTQTARALGAIRTSVNGRTRVHERCGYHVHVSQGGDVTLKFVRRVATLVFLLEDEVLFNLVHAARRQQNASLATKSNFSAMCSSPRNSQAVEAGFLQLPASVRDRFGHKLRHLWTTHNIDDMQQLLLAVPTCYMKTALALKVHEHPDGSETWTIEFRHAQASFEANFVNAWMNLVVAICKMAMLPPAAFATQIDQLLSVLRSPSLRKNEKIGRVLSLFRFGVPGQATSAFGLSMEDWIGRTT